MRRRPNDYPDGVMVLLLVNLTLSALIIGLLIPRGDLSRVDPGGSVSRYAAAAKEWHSPLPYDCRSSCTMYLMHGCVTDQHRLMFHPPKPDTPHWRGVMARHYPPAIKRWFMALPEGREVYVMRGADAIRSGARECSPGGGNGPEDVRVEAVSR